jgi:predicted nucleic acid-binding protein
VSAEADAPYGGGVPVVVDTSAWERTAAPAVARRWAATVFAGDVAITTPAMLEILYQARTRDEFHQLDGLLSELRQVPITRSMSEAAVGAMRELAEKMDGAPLFHRAPLGDYLIAAAAAENGFGVLHYDRHFDRLAEVLPFESIWIAPPGSLD